EQLEHQRIRRRPRQALRRLLSLDNVAHRVDQRQMSERLREVAQVSATARIDLLGIQRQWTRKRQQLFAQLARADMLANLRKRRYEPERTQDERAFVAAEPVVGLLDTVAQHQAVLGQFVGDREHRRADAWIVGRQQAQQDHQQDRRIERSRAVVLDDDDPLLYAVRTD